MFYRQEGDSILYNGKGYLAFYVPEDYFTARCAIVIGEYVNLIGIFNYAIFDEKGNHGELKTFNFPSIFLSQPGDIEIVKDVKLTENSDNQDYRLLKFKDGEKIIVQTKVPQDIKNVEVFFSLFVIAGRIPGTIPYKDIYTYFINSIKENGASYNINNQLFGILVSEICRDAKDKSNPFRLSKAKKNKEWTNYLNVSIKDIPNYISPYVSITSERFDDSIICSTLMNDKDIKSSPLEKVLTS